MPEYEAIITYCTQNSTMLEKMNLKAHYSIPLNQFSRKEEKKFMVTQHQCNHGYQLFGSVTRCNFSCNLQRNCAFMTCKLVKTVWFVKNSSGKSKDSYLPILHSPNSRISMQVARKIASCNRAFRLVKELFYKAFGKR